MPDYSACLNPTCEKRATCGRFRMEHGRYQTVGLFAAEGCTHYIDVSVSTPWRLLSVKEAEDRIDLPYCDCVHGKNLKEHGEHPKFKPDLSCTRCDNTGRRSG